jgi:predicted CoA-binding protein
MADMEALIREFTDERVWAVIGASTNPEKYGNRIFRTLRGAGYAVYGVNPRGGEIDGETLYPSLADLPVKPAVVDIVVPPQVTESVVRECAELGLSRVWMQPGAESDEAIAFCEESGIDAVYGVCAMVHRRTW